MQPAMNHMTGNMGEPNQRVLTNEELGSALRVLMETVQTLAAMVATKKEFGRHEKSNLPSLSQWKRDSCEDWIKKTKQWVELAKLRYPDPTDLNHHVYAEMKYACALDNEAVTLIQATEKTGVTETLTLLQRVFGKNDEDNDIREKIRRFKIRPGTRLATNWLYFKGLIERAMQLKKEPAHDIIAKTFFDELSNSQFATLAMLMKYKYPQSEYPTWQQVRAEMDNIYLSWDSVKFLDQSGRGRNPIHNQATKGQGKKCFLCQREGHIAKRCPQRSPQRRENPKVNQVKMTTEPSKAQAIVDTGAQISVISKEL